MHATDQGKLFGSAVTRSRRRLTADIVVSIGSEAIDAMRAGRMNGERLITEAIRAALPGVRNIVVDLGTVRWTDPTTNRRETFRTPNVVRSALLDLRSAEPKPFQFRLKAAPPSAV
jgi:hypothetical protein